MHAQLHFLFCLLAEARSYTCIARTRTRARSRTCACTHTHSLSLRSLALSLSLSASLSLSLKLDANGTSGTSSAADPRRTPRQCCGQSSFLPQCQYLSRCHFTECCCLHFVFTPLPPHTVCVSLYIYVLHWIQYIVSNASRYGRK
jgi:hypothetical protein